MNSVKEIAKKYNLTVKKYKKVGKVHVITTCEGTYCFKPKENSDIKNVYEYLKKRQFFNVLDRLDKDDEPYEMTPYINEIPMQDEDKATEMMYILSMLHNKTTFYKSISLDEVKCFYEDHVDKLLQIRNYYDNLCYMYDENKFLSPSEYLLIRNIAQIFNTIDLSKHFIELWYTTAKEKTSKRMSLNHNNLDLSHILVGDNSYLISWNKANFDSPVNDLASFFRNNFEVVEFETFFRIYAAKYQLMSHEMYLLLAILLMPLELKFTDDELNNTKEVYKLYLYHSKVVKFALNYDHKNDK